MIFRPVVSAPAALACLLTLALLAWAMPATAAPQGQEPNPPVDISAPSTPPDQGPEPAADPIEAAPPALVGPAAVPPVVVEPTPVAPAAPHDAAQGEAPGPASEAEPMAIPRTQWEPFNREVVRVADGSMRVCSTIVLPFTVVPGIGDIAGTIADWLCIIPAAVAVDYAGANHGSRESHIWQPALALILKKTWETLVDTPIIVVTIGAIVAIAAGSVAATVLGGIPVTVVTAGGVGVTLVVYLALKGVRDSVGNFLFQKAYGVLVPEIGDLATADARANAWLHPGLGGLPGGFGLMATVAGSRPAFNWAWAVPVVGPIWRSGQAASDIKWRTRRYATEVLGNEKQDLASMDGTIDTLTGVQGWSMAAGHVGIGAGVALIGTSLGIALTDTNNADQALAEVVGGAGIVAVIGGAAAITLSVGAERVMPILVPMAWANAE